jgi:hypothetical protein
VEEQQPTVGNPALLQIPQVPSNRSQVSDRPSVSIHRLLQYSNQRPKRFLPSITSQMKRDAPQQFE